MLGCLLAVALRVEQGYWEGVRLPNEGSRHLLNGLRLPSTDKRNVFEHIGRYPWIFHVVHKNTRDCVLGLPKRVEALLLSGKRKIRLANIQKTKEVWSPLYSDVP